MKLEGRNLSLGMQGPDVELLKGELQKLGFTIEATEAGFGRTTHQAVLEFQRTRALETTGVVDEVTANRINAEVDEVPERFIVRGQIRHVDGSPFVGSVVQAFDKDLRSLQQLGRRETNPEGRFELTYTAEDFARDEKGHADLTFQIENREGSRFEKFKLFSLHNGTKIPVEAPQIIFNANPEETVEIVIAEGDLSEYERNLAELTPILQGLSLADLVENEQVQDVTFCTGETGLEPLHIAFMVLAHRLASRTLPPEVFYGLFRQNLPTRLPELLAQHPHVLRHALETSIRLNIVPARLQAEIDNILEHLKELIVEHAFKEPADEGRTSLGALLSTALPSRERQQAFLTAYVRHEGPIEDFWKALRANPEFASEVDQLQFTLQAGIFTRNHLPLVKELQRMKQAGSLNSFKDLAKLDSNDWLEVINKQVEGRAIGFPPDISGADDAEKARNYANGLTRIIEEAFPTPAIASSVGKDDIPGKEDLVRFFANNSKFEFTANINTYLAENPASLDGIADKEGFVNRLKRMQRIFKLTPRYGEMKILIAGGHQSAQSIARMGRTAFTAKYSEQLRGSENARRIYEKAHHTAALALTLFGKYGAVFHSTPVTPGPISPEVTKNTPPHMVPLIEELIEAVPNWTTLFGSPVLCECEHCRSVYSPAAYLVDILWAFLANTSGALTKLFSRRPDIQHIELSCENTNTPMPYVDLVNEVLENAVSPLPLTFSIGLQPDFESDLHNGVISAGLAQAFADNGVSLSTHAKVSIDPASVDEEIHRWRITDGGWSYSIRLDKESNQLEVSTVSQTHGTAEELSANSEYINENAYEILRLQVYPFDLPLDLWIEEARAYIEHLGVRRHTLMETFHGELPPAELTNIEIASEYLSLTTRERQIITGVVPLQSWEFWGLQENNNGIPDPVNDSLTISNWLEALSRVSVFLHRSRLSYKELLELLKTEFINPDETFHIETHPSVKPADQDTCDPDKLVIAPPFPQPTLDRIHRFLRLQRKLGWTIRELDQACSALKPLNLDQPELNDSFLLQLSHIRRLRAQFKKLPLINMLSWWTKIDTAGHDDGTKSLYEQLFLNKAVMNPLDEIFELNAEKDELKIIGKIGEHIPALLAVLGISEADLSLLIEHEFTDSQKIVHDELNLQHLSHLYRIVSFSKALKLSVRDFLSLKPLMLGTNPFDNPQNTFQLVNPFDSMLNTLRFVERARNARTSGFRIAELDYLLRHHFVATSGTAPTEESIALVLDEIRSGLQKIREETTVVPDPVGEITGKNLPLLRWDEALIKEVIATLDGSKLYARPLAVSPIGTLLPADVHTQDYEVPLNALPAGVVFPDALPANLKDKVSFDAVAQRLHFIGMMTEAERTTLLNLPTAPDPAYASAVNELFIRSRTFGKVSYDEVNQRLQFTGPMTLAEKSILDGVNNPTSEYLTAIDALFQAPRIFVAQKMKAFEWPTFSAPLSVFPASLVWPAELKNKIYYDVAAKELRFVGLMSEAERASLLKLSDDLDYLAAVNSLFDAPGNYVPEEKNQFLTSADASQLFDSSDSSAEQRFNLVLTKLLSYLRVSLSESLVKQKIGEALKLEAKAIAALLTQSVNSPAHPAQKSISEFLATEFVESNLNVKLTSDAFPDQFKTFVLLDKIATIISRLKITSEELPWILEHAAGVGWLDINDLPLAETGASPTLFVAWEKLVDLMRLHASLPKGKPTTTDRIEYTANGSETNFSYPFRIFKERDLQLYVNGIFQTPNTDYTVTGVGSATGGNVLLASPPAASASIVILRSFLALTIFDILDIAITFDSVTGDVATAMAEFNAKLSAHTGWSLVDIETLSGKQQQAADTGLLGLTFPGDFKDGQALARIKAGLTLLKRLGVSAAQIVSWLNPDLSADDARSIKQTVKAKYDNSEWLTVAKPLRDVLREKQRAALVSYLVAHPDAAKGQEWEDANGLYEHFLIDVEMSPCAMTSRIKQAICSVQLFVQRCLMNLEEGLSVPLDLALQWKWMKNYRVWEANRKIFLYPENWVEPEWRQADDKSPFFKDLENQLMQNEITKETAEDAFLKYLEKLDDVARLEIVGMYHQKEYPGSATAVLGQARRHSSKPVVDILHVFGRTRGTPHIYYYRQWVNSSRWTAWQKVDLDIEGEHLIPVVWNRRLYLFWPIFTEKANELNPTEDEKTQSNTPTKYWEIQIAGSEYKNGKWSARKVSKELLTLEHYDFLDKSRFAFKGFVSGANLTIRCYRRSFFGSESVAEFRFSGCKGAVLIEPRTGSFSFIPFGCDPENMMIVELGEFGDKLFLPTGESIDIDIDQEVFTSAPALNKTPGTFRVLPPHQDRQFALQRPFFFQDDTRTFFVIPSDEKVRSSVLVVPDSTAPNLIDKIDDKYFIPDQPVDPIGPVTDPPIFEESFDESFDLGASEKKLTTGAQFKPNGNGNAAYPYSMEYISTLLDSTIAEKITAIPTYHTEKRFLFQTFYHPYVCELVKQLKRDGIDGLLQRRNQIELFDKKFFEDDYEPDEISPQVVKKPYPIDDVDFLYGGTYSLYNWEPFFHAPLLIADKFYDNQRFEEAQKWFHYIFDPTDRSKNDVPQRFWKVRPFFENSDATQTIEQLMKLLNQCDEELVKQVDIWRKNPFEPHLIAELRITAYQKTVVMKYLDNLIAWGDQLFRRDTIESINEATQLYVLASEILGKRPEKIPPRMKVSVKTYKQLEPFLDAFSNAFGGEIEDLIPACTEQVTPTVDNPAALPQFYTLYFCIPKNDKLLGFWDTVADRLFKIRHCMNIEGVVRQLPLFEPPIDPALLVKAVAAGLDIGSVLNDMNAPLPPYRFNVMLQKAAELCNEVKSLGGALLSALEKKDGEELALLRSGHELRLLDAVREIKKQQIEEAKENLEGLKKSKAVIEVRRNHYRDIVKVNQNELLQMVELLTAHSFNQIAQVISGAASSAHGMPQIDIGTTPAGLSGAPGVIAKVEFGGSHVGSALQAIASLFNFIAAEHSHDATMASIKGGYDRRWDDWKLQEKLANKELDQIDKQIAAAEMRLALTEQELKNHDLQVENAREVDEYMRNKYTNQELYSWMVSQISAIYFQTYKLAYDIAKRAERTYRFELGLTDSSFIQFGYWDSLRKGLLSGERLSLDLKRMEMSYLDKHKREYEITKHISLVLHDPMALIALRETGQCEVFLSEMLFDADYPGHYMRRNKSVSLTIPCVTGPYTSINCTLTLLSNKVRISSNAQDDYAEHEEEEDTRFVANFAPLQSIATSHAQNDSGMFELNFRDDRYLPFEGAGVISRWRIELTKDKALRQFDYDTISDVVLHLKYTARDGGELLKTAATESLKDLITQSEGAPLHRFFSARHEFPTSWHRFVKPQQSELNHVLTLDLVRERFPFPMRGRQLRLQKLELFLKFKSDVLHANGELLRAFVRTPGTDLTVPTESLPNGIFISLESQWNGLPHIAEIAFDEDMFGKWRLEIQKSDVQVLLTSLRRIVSYSNSPEQPLTDFADAVEDIYFITHYAAADVVE